MRSSISSDNFIQQLFDTVSARKNADPKSSYTASLLAKGPNHIARKLGEESVETIIAAIDGTKKELVSESADLLFHLLALWAAKGITPEMVSAELKRREGVSGIAEKKSRNKK